jgi:signal transduction histidine kinase
VALIQSKKALTHIPNEYRLLTSLLIGLAAFGWLTIYLLSRKLSHPIRRMAEAAREVSHGNYAVELDERVREKEIHEMIVSFKEMASQLKRSEEWRAVLLAGVTHELKTPVTSIKGLILAVREGVVTDEEAEEFLDVSLKEADRLQSMVADLLDYNALASGGVKVKADTLNANRLIKEIVYQWSLVQEDGQVEVQTQLPEASLSVIGDASRIQQILVNLLNNSKQAKSREQGIEIVVTLHRHEENWVDVEVSDNGHGILEEEQRHIFERFFRGELKKHHVRGLGLGLTYSQMLARAQGGDLFLKESTQAGSVFVFRLPVAGNGGS